MEITITLRETELTSLLQSMRETGKMEAGFGFIKGENRVSFGLEESTVTSMLEKIARAKKVEDRSILLDDVIIENDIHEISFLLIPEYKQDVFKESLFKTRDE